MKYLKSTNQCLSWWASSISTNERDFFQVSYTYVSHGPSLDALLLSALSTPCLSGKVEATFPPWLQAFKNPCSSRCLASTHHHFHGGGGNSRERTFEVGLRRTGNGMINKIKQRLCVQRWSDSIISLDKKDGQRTVTCDNLLVITSATSVGPMQVLLSAWHAWHWYYLWVELQQRLLHT